MRATPSYGKMTPCCATPSFPSCGITIRRLQSRYHKRITPCVNLSCRVSVQPVVTETLILGLCQVDQIYSLSQRSATSDSKMDFQILEQYLADLKPDERVLVMPKPYAHTPACPLAGALRCIHASSVSHPEYSPRLTSV